MEEEKKIKIHRSYERVKDQMPWDKVDDKKFNKAYKIACKLNRPELVIFWLKECARGSEKYFEHWLKDISKWSESSKGSPWI